MTDHFTIRPATPDDAAAIAHVQVASWHSTYQAMLPAALIETMTEDSRKPAWVRIITALSETGAGIVHVCETGGEVVGFASFGEQREESLRAAGYTGEVTAIYLLEQAQRGGMGTALMAACAISAQERGHRALSVWVLTDNARARAFYEKLGGKAFEPRQGTLKATVVDEIAYVWDDVTALAGQRAG